MAELREAGREHESGTRRRSGSRPKRDAPYHLEDGYRLEKVVGGLTFPTSIEFGPDGTPYVAEAGFTYPFIYTRARISKVAEGKAEPVATGFEGPLIGLHWQDDGFLATHRGNLSRVELNGKVTDLVTGLPSFGDHHTNHIAAKGGKVYFGQGTATNSGVVGTDNLLLFGWLVAHRKGHDVPPFDVTLSGANFRSVNPFNPLTKAETGPFLPFGEAAKEGQVIGGNEESANGVVYRCNDDGSGLKVHAWGLRNPYGLRFAPDGRLLTIVQGEDHRGSRPAHAPDSLHEVKEGAWYGWPDFSGGIPMTELMQDTDTDNPKQFVTLDHPRLETPLHRFEAHSAAVALDFSPSDDFGPKGSAFIAEFGSEKPFTTGGKPISAGQKVVRMDLGTREPVDFYAKASPLPRTDCPERPVFARFSPDGDALYVLDHGIRTMPKSGSLWKIVRG